MITIPKHLLKEQLGNKIHVFGWNRAAQFILEQLHSDGYAKIKTPSSYKWYKVHQNRLMFCRKEYNKYVKNLQAR